MQERLQKLISRAGVASRRHAEQLILAGQVTVNGHVVTELGSKADPETDHIKVSGKLLQFGQARTYLILNKPSECVATMSDPEGRKSLRDYLYGLPVRVFPAGRLDYHAEGLLLLTNDGDLVNRLLKVSGRLPQVYCIKVKGLLGANTLQEIQKQVGARLVPLKGRTAAPNPWYEATVTEAKSDALRQNLARLGHHVEKIRRVKLADLELGPVEPGKFRMLTIGEVAGLIRAVARAERLGSAQPAVAPQPWVKEFKKPAEYPSRPRTGGAVRFRHARPAASQHRGKPSGAPGGGPRKVTTGRGAHHGSARPAPPQRPWGKPPSRPGGFPSKPTTGGAARPGSGRPAPPQRPPGRQWGKPSGNQFRPKTGGKPWRGPSRKPGSRPDPTRNRRG